MADCLNAGLTTAADERFDVILLDVNLPDSRGWEGLERLRGLRDPVPVVLLTGVDDVETARECLRRGAQDYLIKGQVDGASILRAIEFAIHRQDTVDQLSKIARTDPLTGIANRLTFEDRLDHALRHAVRYRELVALHAIDLDRLKQINDSLGHQAGDIVLRETARRLTSVIRAVDSLFRNGGDEFSLIQTDLADPEGAKILVEKLAGLFVTPVCVEPHELVIGVSIGTAIYPDDADNAHDLIAKADAALYRAKESRGSAMQFA